MGSRLYITHSRKSICFAYLNVGIDLNLLYNSIFKVNSLIINTLLARLQEVNITIVVISAVNVHVHFHVTLRLSFPISAHFDNYL